MIVKLLTEHYLEFLSLTGDCTGSSETTLVKIPRCWKSHVAAQMSSNNLFGVGIYRLRITGKLPLGFRNGLTPFMSTLRKISTCVLFNTRRLFSGIMT